MLYPLNKYLVVKPVEEVESNSGVLIPEDIKIDTSAFKLVEIVEPHSTSQLNYGMKVLVPTHMIQEATFFGETYYLVTENNVVGFYSERKS